MNCDCAATTWKGRRGALAAAGLTAATSGYLTVRGLIDPTAVLAGAEAPPARVLGAYGAVRTITLAGTMLAAGGTRRWGGLRVMLLINAVVQAGDCAVGAWQGSAVRAVGPAAYAVLLSAAAARLRPE